jgi:hypothetical protein
LVNERLSRRASFRDGMKIRLADDQIWIFPAPPKSSDLESTSLGTEYTNLLHAIVEAEDSSDRYLAELALAIFLLGYNYSLSASDFEYLLDFKTELSETTTSQLAFHQIAQEHLRSSLETSRVSWDSRQVASSPGRISRVVSWLRNHPPLVWWSFDSRSC